MPLVLIIHAFGGHPLRFWYPWLAKSLKEVYPSVQVKLLKMTEPQVPRIDVWLEDLCREISQHRRCTEGDSLYLIGHSVGCQTCIRFLALQGTANLLESRGLLLGGVICAGAWFSVIDPWETILPWCEEPIDTATARLTLGTSLLIVYISDNDKYTPDFAGNANMWREKLGGVVHILPGRSHFSGKKQPEILASVCEMLSTDKHCQ